jgi:hypothetical protein
MSLKGRPCRVVNILMDDAEKLSLEPIGRFVMPSEEFRFEGKNRERVCGWVELVLLGQPGKAARGLLRRSMEKMTGLSRLQLMRLIAHSMSNGQVRPSVNRRRRSLVATRGLASNCWPRSMRRTRP